MEIAILSDTLLTQEVRMVTDPVCRMQIDEKKAAGTSEYKGKTYYFCALSCKTRFDQDPEKFTKQQ